MDNAVVRDLIVLFAALVAGGGVLVVRRLVSPERLRENNDFVGFTYAFVGLVYGVYLAFTVVIVWQHFDEAQTIVSREAIVLAQLWRDVEPLPVAQPMHRQLQAYTKSVIDDEFPSMAAGRGAHPRTSAAVAAMWRTLQTAHLTPGDATQAAFLAEAVRQMNAVTEARRGRLLSGDASLPGPMWFLLIAGGAGMVAFAWLIGTPHAWVQVAVTMFLAAILAYAIGIIVAVVNPFAGDISVQPDPYRGILTVFEERLRK